MQHPILHAGMPRQDNAAIARPHGELLSFEDLLLVGGMLMALVIFSSKHAHAQPLLQPPVISAPAATAK